MKGLICWKANSILKILQVERLAEKKDKRFIWKSASSAIGRRQTVQRIQSNVFRRFGRRIKSVYYSVRYKMTGIRPPKIEKWETEKTKMVVAKSLTRYQKEFRRHMTTFVIGSFSFVAALLWNNAIQSTLDMIQFKSNFILFKYMTAIIVSTIAILIIIFLTEINSK
jgi:hypothetical protein